MRAVAEIRRLFEPRGIAVVGASATPGKIGHSLMSNIQAGGYAGGLYPVNPRGGHHPGVGGRPNYCRGRCSG